MTGDNGQRASGESACPPSRGSVKPSAGPREVCHKCPHLRDHGDGAGCTCPSTPPRPGLFFHGFRRNLGISYSLPRARPGGLDPRTLGCKGLSETLLQAGRLVLCMLGIQGHHAGVGGGVNRASILFSDRKGGSGEGPDPWAWCQLLTGPWPPTCVHGLRCTAVCFIHLSFVYSLIRDGAEVPGSLPAALRLPQGVPPHPPPPGRESPSL